NTESRARDMRGDLGLLQCVKLFELLEPEGKDVVVQRLCRTSQQTLERGLIACHIAGVHSYRAAGMAAWLAFEAEPRISYDQFEKAAVRPAFERLVALHAATFFKTEKHGPNKRHKRTLTGLIRTVKYIQTRPERPPCLVAPNAKTVNVDILDSHVFQKKIQV